MVAEVEIEQMGNNFQTVNDLIRAKSALAVTCRNCDHRAYLSAQFLKARLGLHARVGSVSFKCGLCQNSNVRLSAAPEELSRKVLDPRMHFAGVYSKYLD